MKAPHAQTAQLEQAHALAQARRFDDTTCRITMVCSFCELAQSRDLRFDSRLNCRVCSEPLRLVNLAKDAA